MILLLPLLGSYIPEHVEDALLTSSFLWNPLGFVNIAAWFGIRIPADCTHDQDYNSSSRLHYD